MNIRFPTSPAFPAGIERQKRPILSPLGALFTSPKQVVFMSGLTLNVVYASLGIAGLIALACLADLISGAPFGGQTMYDILFMMASGITIYMGIDCLKEG